MSCSHLDLAEVMERLEIYQGGGNVIFVLVVLTYLVNGIEQMVQNLILAKLTIYPRANLYPNDIETLMTPTESGTTIYNRMIQVASELIVFWSFIEFCD